MLLELEATTGGSIRSGLISTRESRDPAMDWFAGEFRLVLEASEVVSHCSAGVLSSSAGEASSSSWKGTTMFPRHISKTMAYATWAGSVSRSEIARLYGAAEPEGVSNLLRSEVR